MRWLAALLLVWLALPAVAQVSADPALTQRIGELVPLLQGSGDYDSTFAPVFRQQVPRERFAPLLEQLRQAIGAPVSVKEVTPTSPTRAALVVAFERGTATMQIAIDPAPPHQVIGLVVTGTQASDDSADKLVADFQALPGASGFGLYRLGEGAPRLVAGWRDEAIAPLGSAFKLWILAEASRQVQAGLRHWHDVVPLGPASLPSGITQGWLAGTPMTLQALATLMISISDNTAADTLLAVLGRDKVEAMVAHAGAAEPVRNQPFLSTREAFVLKGDAALTAAWTGAAPATRRHLLAEQQARIAAAPLDAGLFGDKPVAADSIEWFASPRDLARLLDWLRVHGDATARAILAVNPGTDASTHARFGYVGFKGGSEPGVITLNYLVRGQDGTWLAVTGNWHRSDADTPVLTFTALMNRALALAAGK